MVQLRPARVTEPEGDFLPPDHRTLKPAGDAMGRLGIPELLIILAIIILIFGASRLPEIGRGIGKGIRNFKDATKDGSDKATDKA